MPCILFHRADPHSTQAVQPAADRIGHGVGELSGREQLLRDQQSSVLTIRTAISLPVDGTGITGDAVASASVIGSTTV